MMAAEDIFTEQINSLQDRLAEYGLAMVDFSYSMAPVPENPVSLEEIRELFIDGKMEIIVKINAIIDESGWDICGNDVTIDYSDFRNLYKNAT